MMNRFRAFFLCLISFMALPWACSDPCMEVNCVQGMCVEGNCICEQGFGGTRCDQRLNHSYVGEFVVSNEACNVSGTIATPYDAIIFASASNPTQFTIAGIYGEPMNLGLATAEVLDETGKFSIPLQSFSNQGTQIVGEGLATSGSDELQIAYRLLVNQVVVDSCTAILLRN